MYDILSNHKFVQAVETASQDVGASTSSAIDLYTDGCANRLIALIEVTDVGTDGTIDIVFADSDDNSTYDANFAALEQITEAGFYLAVIDDPKRYLKVVSTAATDAVVWGAKVITFEEQRRPVIQSGTIIVPTYGDGRTAKVATA